MPCADGFDPAHAGGDLPNSAALPEGYRFTIQGLQSPLSSCWLKTPSRHHVHGRERLYNTINPKMRKGGYSTYSQNSQIVNSPPSAQRDGRGQFSSDRGLIIHELQR